MGAKYLVELHNPIKSKDKKRTFTGQKTDKPSIVL